MAQFAAHGLEAEAADVSFSTLDTETYPIAPWSAAPKVVCISMADASEEFLFRESPVEFLQPTTTIRIVGHNVAYDMSCVAATWPETLSVIIDAYERNVIEDTMLIQKLQDNAVGILRGFDFDEEEGPTKIDYELDSLGKRHEVGRKVQTEWMKKEKNPHEPGTLEHWKWSCEHFRFWELDALPLDFWPKEAVLYAKTDARVTYDVRVAQEDYMELCPDHHFQARAAFWLQLMAVHGICTDGPGVEAFAEQTNIDRKLVKERLVEAKLIRPDRALKSGPRKGTIIEGSRDTKLAAARIEKGFTDQGRPAPITDGGKVSTSRAACKESGDPLMLDYAEFAELNAVIKKDIPALRLGMTYPIHTRIDTILATGRPSSSKPNIFNIRRKAGVRECFVPREGKVFISADNGGMELCTLAESMCVLFGRSTLADALNEGRDPHLDVAAQLLQISSSEAAAIYADENHPKHAWLKNGRQVGKVCFHPETEVLTRRGWIRIDQLHPSEQVCSAKLSDDGRVELEWEIPLALTSRPWSGKLVHMKSEGIDLRVTPDHRMCGWEKVGAGRRGLTKLRTATCYPHQLNSLRYWPNAGEMQGSVQVDEALLRFAVATQADGNYAGLKKIRFGFTRRRKIDRMHWLLRWLNVEFETRTTTQGVTEFVVRGEIVERVKELLDEKMLPWWWVELTYPLRVAALDEVRHWDSHSYKNEKGQGNGYNYCSVPKQNADVLQALATLTNQKSRMVQCDHPGYQMANIVSVKQKHRSRGGNLFPTEVHHEGEVFCLTTRNDTIVVRDGGVPVITRQCNFGFPGGLGAETFVHFALQSYDVKLTLDQAHEAKRAWFEAWPDMHNFFAHVSQLVDNDEPVVLPYSGFRRGRASYCAACNTFFQGPGASIFKTQGWLVMKACYLLDPGPLFGSRIANGIYDELILEVDDGTEHESAEELKRLMQEGAKPWLRHVRMKIDAVAMRRWSKDAKKIYKDGRLTAWCSHGVMFDEKAAKKMRKEEIRRRWPRLEGRCPLGHGCMFEGVHYASERHQEAWG